MFQAGFSIGGIIYSLCQFFILALFGRIIFDYIRMFSRDWRPRGVILAIAEAIYAVTDPAMRFARRFIPPLRVGPVAIDLSFIAVFFLVQIIGRVALTLS